MQHFKRVLSLVMATIMLISMSTNMALPISYVVANETQAIQEGDPVNNETSIVLYEEGV